MDDIPDLLEGMKRSGNILKAFVTSIPESNLNERRGDGFWTIAEHVIHLADVQSMLLERIQRFIDEDLPEFVPYFPKDDEKDTRPENIEIDAALMAFQEVREKQIALLTKTDKTVWKKTATHPEYDQYSLYILVRHILMHDHWHMYRMEELWLTKDAYLTDVPG
jgi:uncharacterized damage-inducible protein DinB